MADHLQQAAAGMVILLVHLQVVGQIVDALCKHCDLHFRGAGVALVERIFGHDCLFFFVGHACHLI